jgi:hypothetical protein
MAINLKMFKDILTEKIGTGTGEKLYSQARVYLLLSVVAYFVTLGIVTAKSLKPTLTIEIESIKVVIEALKWVLLLFSGYSFGHKGIEAAKNIFGKTIPDSDDTDATAPVAPQVAPTDIIVPNA